MTPTTQSLWTRAHGGAKPAVVRLTDAEIESAQRNEHGDIHGFERDGVWWGYAYSVERFRKLHAEPLNGIGE